MSKHESNISDQRTPATFIAPPGPRDFTDAKGVTWVMCSCGHRMGGGVTIGTKYAMCPNCRFLCQSGMKIPVVWEDRVPDMREGIIPNES